MAEKHEGHVYILDDHINIDKAWEIVGTISKILEESKPVVFHDSWFVEAENYGGHAVINLKFNPNNPPNIDDVRFDVPIIMGEIGKQEYITVMRYLL